MQQRKKLRLDKILLVLLPLILISTLLFFWVSKDSKEKENSTPTTKNNSTETTVHLSAVGDVLIEEGMYNWMGPNYDFKDYFKDIKKYLKADISFVNQEVLIGGEELGVLGTGYQFNAPNEIGEQIKELGFNVVNLANNHSYDMGLQGIKNSLSFWRQYPDIKTIGMYDNADDRKPLRTIQKNDITFGFLSYATFTNKRIENASEHIPYCGDATNRALTPALRKEIEEEVTAARKNCDVLIVSCHWGPEFQYEPNSQQKEIASFLNSLGVDVILGHHSHGMMPVEWIEDANTKHKTLVAYSLGNFVSADVIVDRSSQEAGNAYSLSGILTMDFIKKEDTISIENVTFIPLVNHYEKNYTNFHLYPMKDYTEVLASKHYRNSYSNHSFTKEWMLKAVDEVMSRPYVKIES